MLDSHSEHMLPSGRPFDPYRPRFAGKLDSEELAFCRENGIELAFDPVQQGWVMLYGLDEDEDFGIVSRRVPVAPRPRSNHSAACTFRRWRLEDLPTYRALLDNPKVWAHLPESYPDPLDEETARTLIEISNASQHHDVCAIEYHGQIVGQARLAFEGTGRAAAPEEAEISYWLGQKHWGRGIASEAVAVFTERGFRRHPALKRIFAVVHAANTPSARVLQKFGYQATGRSTKQPESMTYSISREDVAV